MQFVICSYIGTDVLIQILRSIRKRRKDNDFFVSWIERIIDFTSGATYSLSGNLQKISNYIFIATPESVELSGDFQDLLSAGAFDATGLNVHFN